MSPPLVAWPEFANASIASAVLSPSKPHSFPDDLPLWRALTSATSLDPEATRSYYIKKYKQHQEIAKRRLEEEQRQLYIF